MGKSHYRQETFFFKKKAEIKKNILTLQITEILWIHS